MRNLTKVWKTWTGPLWDGRARSRGPKSALIFDNADLGPLELALRPCNGPVHVFHTFVRFLISAL